MSNKVKIYYLRMATTKNYGIIGLPETWLIYNGMTKCDMAIGPCSCGAWHFLGEDR